MDERLLKALRRQLALLRCERHILKRSIVLFRLGFYQLSPTQIAGISERLQSANSFNQARKMTGVFLERQMQKLAAKESQASWATEIAGESLGEVLRNWIANESYLPQPPHPDLDRLAALRRFWNNIIGQYAYCHALEKREMPLFFEEAVS